MPFQHYEAADLNHLSNEQVQSQLLASGLWTAFRTRPFSKTPVPGSSPRAIFVSAMDTQPLAADPQVIIATESDAFKHGLTVLTRLTEGKVHVGHAPGQVAVNHSNGQVTYNEFSGPHPAGLVGTHIHFLEPVSLRKMVWHVGYQDVIAIGKLFTRGELCTDRIVAVAGPQVNQPILVRTRLGASLSELTAGKLKEGRIVLSPAQCSAVRPSRQLMVIWAVSTSKFRLSAKGEKKSYSVG